MRRGVRMGVVGRCWLGEVNRESEVRIAVPLQVAINIQSMYDQFAVNMHSMCTQCALNMHSMCNRAEGGALLSRSRLEYSLCRFLRSRISHCSPRSRSVYFVACGLVNDMRQ